MAYLGDVNSDGNGDGNVDEQDINEIISHIANGTNNTITNGNVAGRDMLLY